MFLHISITYAKRVCCSLILQQTLEPVKKPSVGVDAHIDPFNPFSCTPIGDD